MKRIILMFYTLIQTATWVLRTMLKQKKIPCEVINSRLLKLGGRYICAMELMSGPLSKMNGKLTMDNNIRCIKNICKHLKCLNDHGLSYTDLKTDNVLFKCIDKKNIKIFVSANYFITLIMLMYIFYNKIGINFATLALCLFFLSLVRGLELYISFLLPNKFTIVLSLGFNHIEIVNSPFKEIVEPTFTYWSVPLNDIAFSLAIWSGGKSGKVM